MAPVAGECSLPECVLYPLVQAVNICRQGLQTTCCFSLSSPQSQTGPSVGVSLSMQSGHCWPSHAVLTDNHHMPHSPSPEVAVGLQVHLFVVVVVILQGNDQ